jgi:hypothetical protein
MRLASAVSAVAVTAALAGAAAGSAYVPDNAKAQSDGKVATEKVVAFDLGTCHGKRAYLKYIWYFPAYRKAPSRRQANPACI